MSSSFKPVTSLGTEDVGPDSTRVILAAFIT